MIKYCIISFWSVVLFIACKQSPLPQFTDVSEKCGISFVNTISETEGENIFTYEYMYNGAGVAIGDVNNDNLPEIFFSANQLPCQLYLNKGNLQFENITEHANVAGKPGWKTGVSMADVNSDGWLDIYVCYSGRGERSNQLFINKGVSNGVPVFVDEAKQYGLDAPGTNSNQSVFFDYDNDGDLDMFLLNHAVVFYSPLVNTYKLRHKRHPYYSNYLFRNDNGHFTDVSSESRIAGGGNNFGLGVVAADINNDGWMDLYMTNDYEEQDFLLLNKHDGTFDEVTKQSLKHISKYGMGCDVADYNNDGLMDIIVPDMWPEDNFRQKVLRGPDEYDKYNLLVDTGYMHQNMRNTLQLNMGCDKNGLPVFSEIGQLAGISNTDWSWSSLSADFDNDGGKDLYITNGFWRDFSNMDFQTYQVAAYMRENGPGASLHKLIDSMPQTRLSNYMFRNKGDLCFQNVTRDWGLFVSNVSNGAAYADLDKDGDLDLVVNNMGEKASVYRNNNIANGNYLTIKLKGSQRNSRAIGSRISITTASGKYQVAEQQPVRGYLSCMEPLVHFGLGLDTVIKTLTVHWPGGTSSVIKNIRANQTLEIDQLSAIKDTIAVSPSMTVFADFTTQAGIDFYHPENAYVDFKQETLLPWQLSKQGPKMAKADVDGDGLEDVFIGAPLGAGGSLFIQDKDGHFKRSTSQPWKEDDGCDDIQSVFFDADGDKDMDLYVVSGGNENMDPAAMQDRLYVNDGKGRFKKTKEALPVMNASKGCVAVADFNSDGRTDIFIGGRVVPGSYGIIPESYLLQNETVSGNIKFVNVTTRVSPALQRTGMVTTAAWTDLNKDNLPDLLIAGEWMPVRVFVNKKGRLEEETNQYGLQHSDGLWTCIVPMDIDNDGDEDFLLGNLAPNTQFRASVQQPMTLHVNDFFKSGRVQPILCYYIQGQSFPYASRNEIVEDMPFLKKKFLYYRDYASARLEDVFTSAQMQGAQASRVCELKNCWLENTGKGKLILHELPVAAQFSPIQGAVSIDADNDGSKEIFAAGNFYPFRVQLGREDAGKGILLRWDSGSHNLAISPLDMGVVADGDVRDVLQIHTAKKDRLILISRNSDSVMVIKSKSLQKGGNKVVSGRVHKRLLLTKLEL